MIVKFKIENNFLIIPMAPKRDVPQGLTVMYGEMAKMDKDIGHFPAIMCDLKAGKTEYELPPVGALEGFTVESIKEVNVDDQALDVISRPHGV